MQSNTCKTAKSFFIVFLVDFSLFFFDLIKKFIKTIKLDIKPNEDNIIKIIGEYLERKRPIFKSHPILLFSNSSPEKQLKC